MKRALRVAAVTAAVALGSVMLQNLAVAAGTDQSPAAIAVPILRDPSSTTTSAGPAPTRPAVLSIPVATTQPVAVAAPVAAPVAAAPTVAGQEGSLVIASIGLRLPVVLGGQSAIDRGLVTHFEGAGWRPAVPAGTAGTYWLAAHHATHGSPFGALPNIRVGAIIAIDPVRGAEIRYQVTSIELVGTRASNLTVYGPDTSTSRILLQTCEGGASRLLVHGVLVP